MTEDPKDSPILDVPEDFFAVPDDVFERWQSIPGDAQLDLKLRRGDWDNLLAMFQQSAILQAEGVKLAFAAAGHNEAETDRRLAEWSAIFYKMTGLQNKFLAGLILAVEDARNGG